MPLSFKEDVFHIGQIDMAAQIPLIIHREETLALLVAHLLHQFRDGKFAGDRRKILCLGFIHEDSGQSFILDIADLFRDTVTVTQAFRAVAQAKKRPQEGIERLTRRLVGETLRRDSVIATMIDRIKVLFEPAETSAT